MSTAKKLLALTLTLTITTSLLSGCSKGDSSSASSADSSAPGSSSSTQSSDVTPMDLAGVTDPYLSTAGLTGDTVVAHAGQYEITADSYLYWLCYAIESYTAQTGSTEINWNELVGITVLEQYLAEAALESAAFYRLLPAMGEKEGLTPAREDLDYMLQDLAKVEEELGGADKVDHILWYQMHSRDHYQQAYVASLYHALLQDHFFGQGSDGYPSDEDVQTHIEDELGYYRVKHILLSTKDSETDAPLSDADKAEKKALAEDLLAQLRDADDPVALFDQLMNEHSEDPGLTSYPNGYEAYAGQMVPEFEAASYALAHNEISDIVESDHGYHIILRLPMDLDKFRAYIIADRMQTLVTQWVAENPVETNEAFDKIDTPAFWENVLSLRAAVEAEIEADEAAK